VADANAAPDLSCVTIGILTALEEEYAACRDVFDPDRSGAEHHRRATSGNFTCWLCQVASRSGDGSHVVAITLLPDMGNNSAAIAANILLQHCPKTQFLIMCGIAGAVPNPVKPEDHVRLGDIVVSSSAGIIQYDRGKQRDPRSLDSPKENGTSPDPLAGLEHRSPPRPPSPELLGAVQRMMADEHSLGQDDHREWETNIKEFFARCRDKEKWKRPAPNKDRLIDSPDGKGPSTTHPKDRARRKRSDGVKYPRVFRGSIDST
jgi:nucleoside phosphorylase